MADQKINALPVKTSPTTGDKMLMIGSAEEYQIDYDQLATAILNKLTSKTFALDQGTKTLVAALNELNSNIKKWYTGSSFEEVCDLIVANTDLKYSISNIEDIIPGISSGIAKLPYRGSGAISHALIFKHSDNYYSGIVMSYGSDGIYFFKKSANYFSIAKI